METKHLALRVKRRKNNFNVHAILFEREHKDIYDDPPVLASAWGRHKNKETAINLAMVKLDKKLEGISKLPT